MKIFEESPRPQQAQDVCKAHVRTAVL